jgi:hypothetical protein
MMDDKTRQLVLDRLAHIDRGITALYRSQTRLIELLEQLMRELDKANG